MIPVFVAAPEQFKDSKGTTHNPSVPATAKLVSDILSAWGTARFYLDAAALPISATGNPLVDIAAEARTRGMSLIPMLRSGSPQYLQAVQTVAAVDGRGAGLMIDLQDMASMATWIAQYPLPIHETDLIVNLERNVETVLNLGAVIDQAFQQLHQGSNWRSVTICGTSMPDNFTGFTAGTHLIPRREIALWKRLQNVALPYRLDFGD